MCWIWAKLTTWEPVRLQINHKPSRAWPKPPTAKIKIVGHAALRNTWRQLLRQAACWEMAPLSLLPLEVDEKQSWHRWRVITSKQAAVRSGAEAVEWWILKSEKKRSTGSTGRIGVMVIWVDEEIKWSHIRARALQRRDSNPPHSPLLAAPLYTHAERTRTHSSHKCMVSKWRWLLVDGAMYYIYRWQMWEGSKTSGAAMRKNETGASQESINTFTFLSLSSILCCLCRTVCTQDKSSQVRIYFWSALKMTAVDQRGFRVNTTSKIKTE